MAMMTTTPARLFPFVLLVHLAIWMAVDLKGESAVPLTLPIVALAYCEASLAGLWLILGRGSAWMRLIVVGILVAIWGGVFHLELERLNLFREEFLQTIWTYFLLRQGAELSPSPTAWMIGLGMSLAAFVSAGMGILWRILGWRVVIPTTRRAIRASADDSPPEDSYGEAGFHPADFTISNLLQLTTAVAVVAWLWAGVRPTTVSVALLILGFIVPTWTSVLAWSLFAREYRKEKFLVALAVIMVTCLGLFYATQSVNGQLTLFAFVTLETLMSIGLLSGLRTAGFDFIGPAEQHRPSAAWLNSLRMRWSRVSGKFITVSATESKMQQVPRYEPRGLGPSHVKLFIPGLVGLSVFVDAILYLKLQVQGSSEFTLGSIFMLLASQIGVLMMFLGLARPLSVTRIGLSFLGIGAFSIMLANVTKEDKLSFFLFFSISALLDLGVALVLRPFGVMWTHQSPDGSGERFPEKSRFQFTLAQIFIWTAIMAVMLGGIKAFDSRATDWSGILSWDFARVSTVPFFSTLLSTWLVFSKAAMGLRCAVAIVGYIGLMYLTPGHFDWHDAWLTFAMLGWSIFSFAVIRTAGYRLRRRRN